MSRAKKPKNKLKSYAKYSNMAFQMIAIIVIGTFGGLKLDEYIGWHFPVFTILFSLMSVSFAIYISIKDVLK
ncbi:MAG: ATPase F0F1 [Bacteroidetes bacterium 4572_77]|nr:MAG: ATPase F0F1 [Bacteroidetes bacterium 4572_77]